MGWGYAGEIYKDDKVGFQMPWKGEMITLLGKKKEMLRESALY